MAPLRSRLRTTLVVVFHFLHIISPVETGPNNTPVRPRGCVTAYFVTLARDSKTPTLHIHRGFNDILPEGWNIRSYNFSLSGIHSFGSPTRTLWRKPSSISSSKCTYCFPNFITTVPYVMSGSDCAAWLVSRGVSCNRRGCSARPFESREGFGAAGRH